MTLTFDEVCSRHSGTTQTLASRVDWNLSC